MTKSYVTMFTCPICHEPNGTLGLDRRVRDTFEQYTPSPDPCEKCQKQYLTNGVLLIDPTNGCLVVLKVSAFKRIFNVPVPEKHIAYTDSEVLVKLQGGE